MEIEDSADWSGFYSCEDFPLLYPGGFLIPPGSYDHRLNLGDINGVTFWSKVIATGTELVVSAWPPRVT